MGTQILVIFVIPTNARPWQDLPHPALMASSMVALLVAMGLPFTPLAHFFGFQTPAPAVLVAVAALAAAYLISAELLKRWASQQRASSGPITSQVPYVPPKRP